MGAKNGSSAPPSKRTLRDSGNSPERIPTIRLPARFRRRKPGLVENARLFALASLATADAFIAIFDAKYAYNFWRPVTAIRNGDMDGNDATSGMPLGSR